MNKKTMKLITAIVTFAMIMTLSLSVFAATPSDIKAEGTVKGEQTILSVGKSIVGILQTVGVVVSVIVIIVIGIKYMMGSASEKAEYKKTMIPYLVGAILIFGASVFANVVYEFATGIK